MTIQFRKSSSDRDAFELAGPALIFVEGNHVDNRKREHTFDAARLHKLVDNTNAFMREGRRVPFQKDHQKTQDFNIGDVEGEFYCEMIGRHNLPDPKYSHLIGKLGVFVNNLIARGKSTVDAIKQGRIKTLSPGIDPATESFVEISATPIPAIVGPSIMFSRDGSSEGEIILFESSIMNPRPSASVDPSVDDYDANQENLVSRKTKVFSMEEALGRGENVKQLRTKYNELANALWMVLSSYYSAGEEELQGKDPVKESYNSIEFFVKEIEDVFELTFKEEEQKQDAEISGANINKGGAGVRSPGAANSSNPPANYSRFNTTTLFTRRKLK